MKKQFRKIIIILLWILLWQLAAVTIHNKIIFVGPLEAFQALAAQLFTRDFWLTIFSSLLRIAAGYLTAFLAGIFMGALAGRFSLLREFLEPVTGLLQSVPVASFVILALIWIGSTNLSVLITFLVVFPIIYRNVLEGIQQVDRPLLEMARIFRLTSWKKLVYLYRPALIPYLQTGCRISLGMAWKSGIAAEVIGVPAHSIGEKLYMAKIYLSTAELFAWTFVIIVVSKVFEKLFLSILNLFARDLQFSRSSQAFCQSEQVIPNRESDHRAVFQTGNSTVRSVPTALDSAAKSFGESNGSSEPVLIRNLSKSYQNQSVLDDFSGNLEPGRIYCLLGPSGRGKTTLLRLILGLEHAEMGSITGTKQQKISAVFQEDRLFDFLTPVKNVQLVCEKSVSQTAVTGLLEEFLEPEALSKPVSHLSGGMKRRVTIARALAAPSQLLIMDEPFTGLDDVTREKVIRLILKYRNGRTLLLVTHQEEDVNSLKADTIRLN